LANTDLLKDVILSTLAEIEEDEVVEKIEEKKQEAKISVEDDSPINLFQDSPIQEKKVEPTPKPTLKLEEPDSKYLKDIQEKISTLFEGLKSEDITNTEQKLNLTLKYLEYILISLDDKLK
jgi:Mg2+ and Co2+ transporter CorA